MTQAIAILIPARLASTRLPNKPLADIHGKPMILHVVDQAMKAALGPVIVASGDPEITTVISGYGVDVVETDPALPSGTDRIAAALEAFDPKGVLTRVINLQGDLPTITPHSLKILGRLLENPLYHMSTLASPIATEAEGLSPHVVKAVLSLRQEELAEGVYFTRTPLSSSDGQMYHHIGVYGFQRSALRRFIALSPTPLEVYERLEQLRALESGMRIGVGILPTAPHGVDTPEDLARIRNFLAAG